MITYSYECENCKYEFDTPQSIKDRPLKKCPECKKNKLERVIHGGLAVFVDNGPTTLESQAERNTKRMGNYERQEKRENDLQGQIEKKNLAQQELAIKYGSNPIKFEKPEAGKPSAGQITKMTPAQKEKYISTGAY